MDELENEFIEELQQLQCPNFSSRFLAGADLMFKYFSRMGRAIEKEVKPK